MQRIRLRRRSRRLNLPEISLTPLIDTALTLLVIFMITAPMVRNGIKIDLPHGKSKEGGIQQDVILTIDKKGRLYLNNVSLAKRDVKAAISKELKDRLDTPVYIRADKGISYGIVIEIVDELKQAGVHYVAMSTQSPTN